MRYSVFVTIVVFFLAVSCQSVASPERAPNLASVQAAAAEVGKEGLLFGKHSRRTVVADGRRRRAWRQRRRKKII